MTTKAELANAVRFLSIDAVEMAASGHPGMPMGMADIATVLWGDFLQHNPSNPAWVNRDRFVLSNGHGSMLQYALLHLTGYDVSIKDLQNFRKLHSNTPGHPEYGLTSGVEATTGPLGQGIAMAVGMAIAEQLLATTFNQKKFPVIDHFTYCFAGDGCLMEGISHEACSLAGTLGLGKLILFWDNNGVSIDGSVENWFTEDVAMRFAAYNWHVIEIDGHSYSEITDAIKLAQQDLRPTIICCKTIIGFGAPLAGNARCHGAPLGTEQIAAAREKLDWQYPPFSIPEDIYAIWNAKVNGAKQEEKWQQMFADYKGKYPQLAKEFLRRIAGEATSDLQAVCQQVITNFNDEQKELATRQSSKIVLDMISKVLPELLGGSADLSGSNLTLHDNAIVFEKKQNKVFNYLHYGVREFAMSAIMNGIALHKGFIPYGGTFLVFTDYAKNAIRLSALMQQKVIYVLSHDSIGLGEDGPTHQPVEQLNTLRMVPNLAVWRPCDSLETVIAWQQALLAKGPSCLVLSRQKLTQQVSKQMSTNVAKGGYVLLDDKQIQAVIIATGSEVSLAMQAALDLKAQGIGIRVVSMPNVGRFLQEDLSYQRNVLPDDCIRVVVEAGASALWYRLVGLTGAVVGLDEFGHSAPAKDVYTAVGITVDAVKQVVLATLEKKDAKKDSN